MSEDEHFLSRWSRRKQEAKQPAQDERAPADAGAAIVDVQTAAAEPVAAQNPRAEEFDRVSLPPVDMIEATSDVRAFLTKGVPADLTRAALRRAWSSDPAIRDFVGLSENAWDFNAPETIPGFGGALLVEEVRRILAQMMPSEPEAEAESEEGDAASVEVAHAENQDEAEPAHSSGITPQDEKHALVKSGEPSQAAVVVPHPRQSATIDNKKKDVASQNENNG